MQTQLEMFGMTDIGRKRHSNEDQFMVADLCRSIRVHQSSLPVDHRTQLFGTTQGQLFVVADGMGGHEAGERASQLALNGVVDQLLNCLTPQKSDGNMDDEAFQDQLKAALRHCQTLIEHDVEMAPQRKGMGSTLTMAYVLWPKLFLVHVGDSRCYLIRNGKIQQLTRDHTMSSTMYANEPERDEALPDDDGPFSNVLWNVLGGQGDIHPDASSIELQPNDAIVLCTDGLTRYISRKQIREAVSGDSPLNTVCEMLVAKANELGGSDNISIVACRCNSSSSISAPVTELTVDTVDSAKFNDTEDLLPASS